MFSKHRIRLVARNEVVEYRDESGTYWFDVALNKGTWTIFLPASVGEIGHVRPVERSEVEPIIPAVSEFLANVKWFGMFGGPYRVEIKVRR